MCQITPFSWSSHLTNDRKNMNKMPTLFSSLWQQLSIIVFYLKRKIRLTPILHLTGQHIAIQTQEG
uniref:Uncharacterized protein n=1 Tax=Anguilla anguilla TaxID=7936 RepID=A0A0E9XFP8_ANGAN